MVDSGNNEDNEHINVPTNLIDNLTSIHSALGSLNSSMDSVHTKVDSFTAVSEDHGERLSKLELQKAIKEDRLKIVGKIATLPCLGGILAFLYNKFGG